MKKNKVVLIIISLFVMFNINYVNAEEKCSDEKINNLKKQVKNVSMVSEYNEELSGEGSPNRYTITIYELPKDFYISNKNMSDFYDSNDMINGVIVADVYYDDNTFKVYSNECPNQSLKTITLNQKKYNSFSTYKECEGISEGELDVCNKFYDGDITYEKFVKIVEKYKNSQKIVSINNKKDKSITKYLLMGLITVIIISAIVLFVWRYKKNRLD